jgi:phosphoglycerate-specific signal transduction histidine kinase
MQNRSTGRLFVYGRREDYSGRCLRRLVEDLGVDPEVAELILSLNNQVLELQARLRELEAELEHRQAARAARLSHFQQLIYEATWIEGDGLEEAG